MSIFMSAVKKILALGLVGVTTAGSIGGCTETRDESGIKNHVSAITGTLVNEPTIRIHSIVVGDFDKDGEKDALYLGDDGDIGIAYSVEASRSEDEEPEYSIDNIRYAVAFKVDLPFYIPGRWSVSVHEMKTKPHSILRSGYVKDAEYMDGWLAYLELRDVNRDNILDITFHPDLNTYYTHKIGLFYYGDGKGKFVEAHKNL